jgi:hypothetical protein
MVILLVALMAFAKEGKLAETMVSAKDDAMAV